MSKSVIATIVLAAVCTSAGCKDHTPAFHSNADRPASQSPYAGAWVNVTNAERVFSITPEGRAFVVQDETRKKYVGTMSNGVLRVSTPLGSIEMLHVRSTDHLVAAGDEYRRMTAGEMTALEGHMNARQAQRNSMAGMRAVATAWEARATDINAYTVDEIRAGPVPTESLARALSPTYLKEMPRIDGWNNPFLFHVTDDGGGYRITSAGVNGRPDDTPPGPNRSPNADIVFVNGSFLSYPEGIQ